jgi:hypothetical protein
MWVIMNNKIKLIFLIAISHSSYASVSVIDQSILTQEQQAIQSYTSSINTALSTITSTIDNKKQIDSIHSIIEDEDSIINTCNNRCDNKSLQAIKSNMDRFNQQLTDNFNQYTNGLTAKVTNIKSIETLLTSSNGNTKQANLALQKATQKEILMLNNTMENIQNILLIEKQQNIEMQKIEEKNNQDFYRGFKDINL